MKRTQLISADWFLQKRCVSGVKLTKVALRRLILRFEPGILLVNGQSPSSFLEVALKIWHLSEMVYP
jgi:hypothetical protein